MESTEGWSWPHASKLEAQLNHKDLEHKLGTFPAPGHSVRNEKSFLCRRLGVCWVDDSSPRKATSTKWNERAMKSLWAPAGVKHNSSNSRAITIRGERSVDMKFINVLRHAFVSVAGNSAATRGSFGPTSRMFLGGVMLASLALTACGGGGGDGGGGNPGGS